MLSDTQLGENWFCMIRKTEITDPFSGDPLPSDIRWLIRCIELGSMSAAASERNVAVSQASRAIDRLEAVFGAKLLRRSTHGLSLTAEGLTVVASGREILARLSDLNTLVTGRHAHVAGPVRIAVSASIADELLVPALPQLRAEFPHLRVSLIAEDRVSDLPTEGVDIGLRTAVGPSDSVIARRLGEFQRALYASPSYVAQHGTPETPADLQRHLTVTHTGLGQFNHWRFCLHGKISETIVSGGHAANSTWLIQQMLREGLGIGMLTMPLAARMVATHELIEVLGQFRDPTKHAIFAVVLPERQRTPRIRAVVDFLARVTASSWVA